MTVFNLHLTWSVSKIWFSRSIPFFSLKSLPPFIFTCRTPTLLVFTSLIALSVSVVNFYFSLRSHAHVFHYQLQASAPQFLSPSCISPTPQTHPSCCLSPSHSIWTMCTFTEPFLLSVDGKSSKLWSHPVTYLSLAPHRQPNCKFSWLYP